MDLSISGKPQIRNPPGDGPDLQRCAFKPLPDSFNSFLVPCPSVLYNGLTTKYETVRGPPV